MVTGPKIFLAGMQYPAGRGGQSMQNAEVPGRHSRRREVCMKTKVIAVAAVVVAAAMWTATVSAQRPGGLGPRGGGQGQGQGLGMMGRGPGGPGGPAGRGGAGPMLAGLGLSEEQQTQVKALFESERAAEEQNRQAMGELRQQLHAAVFAATVDQGAVSSLQAKIVAAEQAQLSRHVQTQLTLSGILTPEQRAKVAAHQGRGGRGPGGEGGGRGPRGPRGPRGGR